MADYTGYVEVIGQLIPKNKANFKVVDANDISVHGKDSGISLESILENVDSPIKDYVQTQIAGSSFGGNTVINKVLLMLGLDSNGDPKDTSSGSGSSSGDGESSGSIYDYINTKVKDEENARKAQIEALVGGSTISDQISTYVTQNDLWNGVKVQNFVNTSLDAFRTSMMREEANNDGDVIAAIKTRLIGYTTRTDARSISEDVLSPETTARELADGRLEARLEIIEDKISSVSGVTVIVETIEELQQKQDKTVIYWCIEDNHWYYFDETRLEFVAGGTIASIEMDKTLTKEGNAADAKAVGDKFTATNTTISALTSTVNGILNKTDHMSIESDVFNNKYMAVEVDANGSILSYYDTYGNKTFANNVYSQNINEMTTFIRNLNLRVKVLEQQIGNEYVMPVNLN